MARAELPEDWLEALNDFLNEKAGEEGLPCPVSGEPVPIGDWNAPAGAVALPGAEGAPPYLALPLTSPSGGVVLISVVKLREWRGAGGKGDRPEAGAGGPERKAPASRDAGASAESNRRDQAE